MPSFAAWLAALFAACAGFAADSPLQPPSIEPSRVWNPFVPGPDNRVLHLRILVLNYNPIVPDEGHRRLSEVFRWTDPERLALRYLAAMEAACGGAIRYEITEWRNLNEIYAQRDGHRYTVADYVRNRRTGKGWRERAEADYPRLLAEQGVPEMVSRGLVDEVWIFSDHYFGLWEASMAGPGAFNINGGVYPEVPSTRPFAFYGFNYERGVAEMMHDAAHRTEATLNRVYGGWKLKEPRSNWGKFSANAAESGGLAGVGTCHFPANAEKGYDYGNRREVASWADAFLTYPQLDWTTRPVSRSTWSSGPDYHLDYMKWYFAHLPRAAGINADGRQNNWFKYIWDFENYDRRGRPLPPRARLIGSPVALPGERVLHFSASFSSASHTDSAHLASAVLEAIGPDGARWPVTFLGASSRSSGPHVVGAFSVAPPGGVWKGEQAGVYRVQLRADALRDLAGRPFSASDVGSFRVAAGSGPSSLPIDASTLFHWPAEGNAAVVKGSAAEKSEGLVAVEGVVGKAARFERGTRLEFPCARSIEAGKGTIEFWLNPDFLPDDKVGHVLLMAGQAFDRGLLLSRDGAGNLRFLQWGDDRATPEIEHNVERGIGTSAQSWVRGKWRHIAAAWDSADGLMALYVDGRLIEAHTNGVRLDAFSLAAWSIGADLQGGQEAPATFDELRISSRMKSAEEILAAYESGQPPGELTPTAMRLLLAPGNTTRVWLRESATNSESVDRSHEATWRSSDPEVVTMLSTGRLKAERIGRATVKVLHRGRAAQIDVEVVDTLPTARLVRFELSAGPGGPLVAQVAFKSAHLLAENSIGFGDLLLHGEGVFQFAEKRTLDGAADGETKVTYLFPIPAAGWPASATRCRLQLAAWQVHDAAGAFFGESDLATMELSLPR